MSQKNKHRMPALLLSSFFTLSTLVIAASLNSIDRAPRKELFDTKVSFKVEKKQKIKAKRKVRKKRKKLKNIKQAPPLSPNSIPAVALELEMPSVSKDSFLEEAELQEATQPPVPSPSNPMPEYPYKARLDGIQGKVVVRVLVDEYGFVIRSKITQSDDNFDDEVLKVIREWNFTPAKNKGGESVEKWVEVPFSFVL